MLYKILADLVVLIHFAWILFMLWGFFLTMCGSISIYVLRREKDRWKIFFDRWIFRTIHLGGIVYVILLDRFRGIALPFDHDGEWIKGTLQYRTDLSWLFCRSLHRKDSLS